MTQNPFDQLSKQFLEELLSPVGTVQRTLEVPGEPKFVDIWFTPNAEATAPDLGLLSRIAETACLLEPFRNPPTRSEVRTCLLKLFWVQEDFRRKNQQENRSIKEDDLPRLWILATSVSKPLLQDCGATLKADWMPGVYFLPEIFKAAIIAIDELPVTRETLELRVLGRGETQKQAIAEIRAMPTDDPQRNQILRILANWKVTIELSEVSDVDAREELMTFSQAFLEWEQATEQRGVQQGIQQGVQEGKAKLVIALLNARLGTVEPPIASQIQRLSSTQLDTLAIELLNFTTLTNLERWLVQRE